MQRASNFLIEKETKMPTNLIDSNDISLNNKKSFKKLLNLKKKHPLSFCILQSSFLAKSKTTHIF